MPALALTDYGNLFGALELVLSHVKSMVLKPIIGSEIYLTEDRLEKNKKKIDYAAKLGSFSSK